MVRRRVPAQERAQAEKELFDGPLKKIADRARAARCSIECVWSVDKANRTSPIYPQLTTVRVNGRLCGIHKIKISATRDKVTTVAYGITTIALVRLRALQAVIFVIERKDLDDVVYVVPSYILLTALFGSAERSFASIAVPTDRRATLRGRRSLIDWWRYKNAWDILETLK